MRDLKVSRNMARSVLRGFKPSFFAWPSEQCLRDFLPSLLLLLNVRAFPVFLGCRIPSLWAARSLGASELLSQPARCKVPDCSLERD